MPTFHRRPATPAVPVAVNALWGPLTAIPHTGSSGVTNSTLNDVDNALAVVFVAPKAGVLDRIGVSVATSTAPPAYNVGFVTLDGSRLPTTTPAGGSAVQSWTPPGTGFTWVTLTTPLTVAIGDVVCASIWPGAVAPDGTHFIAVRRSSTLTSIGGLPHILEFVTAWTRLAVNLIGGLSARYNDGTVAAGVGITGAPTSAQFTNATAQNEYGALFNLPFPVICTGVQVINDPTALPSAFTVKLYDGTTELLSQVVNGLDMPTTAAGVAKIPMVPTVLTANHDYRLTVLATDTDSRNIAILPVPDTDTKNFVTEGARWQMTNRPAGGAWIDTPLSIPLMALRLSQIG